MVKILNNSIPGAMKSPFNPLYDLPGYNSITSPARHSVMNGYAHVEKLVAGNLYLTDLEDVINYLVCHDRVCPKDDVALVVRQYGVVVPSDSMVCDYFMASLKYYTPPSKREDLRLAVMRELWNYPQTTKTFVYYANCLKNLVEQNDSLMRSWIQELFRTDIPTNPDLDPSKIEKDVEKDLLMMLASVNHEVLEGKSVEKAITEAPEGARTLYSYCKYAEQRVLEMKLLLRTFFSVDADIAKPMYHPRMTRKVVIVSDTDSVVFTTQSMVRWYCGKLSFDRKSYEACAFAVWMVSQTLEHLFARLSVGFGMTGEDVYRISMKNEYLFPIMMRTHASKHYAGVQLIKEGKRLPTPIYDIKGVQFRGSALSADTNKDVEDFLIWVLDRSMTEEGITTTEVLGRVVKHEKKIYDSLMSGEMTFLKGASVKSKEDYADPEKSNYFYYLMWQEVFAPKFGDFAIPNKGFSIPIAGKGQGLFHPEWQQSLLKFDAGLHQRLNTFLERMQKTGKKITQIILPPALDAIPEILRPLIDARGIISANGAPHYLALQALGLGTVNTKMKQVVSDYFDTEGFSLYS